MKLDQDPRVALSWAPDGKRSIGRPKMTERMLVVYARSWTLSSWSAVAVVVRDRERWSDLISCGKEQVLK